MYDGDLLVLSGSEVFALLEGREAELIRTVRRAYEIHAAGNSYLPHSIFLRLPEDRNRIIGLPAYLGEEAAIAGMKWVSSFPGNVERGLNRATAVIIINSLVTGRPDAMLEGSIISARRTAASAALSAQVLHGSRAVNSLGMIGCGLISFEIARFVTTALPSIKSLTIFDLSEQRASQFADHCRRLLDITVNIAEDIDAVFRSSTLISFATTATTPYISDLSACLPGSTLMHISLRDITPEAMLQCVNVVDDIDHICRARTSVHLAEELHGSRDFIRCTLADIMRWHTTARDNPDDIVIFSPFGLGVLDLAVGKLVCELAHKQGIGKITKRFLPGSWLDEKRREPDVVIEPAA
jgi:2,3-diaminopropionate biosynthesis protein SbnB